MREFVNPAQPDLLQPGTDVMVATVVHLFHNRQEVSSWMTEKFLGEFQRFVGKDLGTGQQIITADQLKVEGFSEQAVGLHMLQTTDAGPVSSTIVDFGVGRLPGRWRMW